jgi:hypothetical protein
LALALTETLDDALAVVVVPPARLAALEQALEHDGLGRVEKEHEG